MSVTTAFAALVSPAPASPDRKLAQLRDGLMVEILQTERSAQLHAQREAARLGDSEPARALLACARHAARASRDWTAVARAYDLPGRTLGSVLGRGFSAARQYVLDHLIEEGRSYRGTLLGLRHGIDTVVMMRHVSDATGATALAGLCARWLDERVPLVVDVEHGLRWFAARPEVAVARVARARAASTAAHRA